MGLLLVLALAALPVAQGPVVREVHRWQVSDDGSTLAMGAGREVWRVQDWKPLGNNYVHFYYYPEARRFVVTDVSQSAYLDLPRQWRWEDDHVAFCMRDAEHWAVLFNVGRAGHDRTHLPEGAQMVAFVDKSKRGEHPNREVILSTREPGSTIATTMAHVETNQVAVGTVVLSSLEYGAFEGWRVLKGGKAQRIFSRAMSRRGTNFRFGEGVAVGTTRLVYRLLSDGGRLRVLSGPTGKTSVLPLPEGADVARMVVAKDDLYIHSPAKRGTLRYSFETRKWSTLADLAVICISGNGKWGAFAGPDGRATVRRL